MLKAIGIKTVAAKILPAKAAPKKAPAPKKKPAEKSTLSKIAAAIVEPIKEIPAAVASIPEKISEVIHPHPTPEATHSPDPA